MEGARLAHLGRRDAATPRRLPKLEMLEQMVTQQAAAMAYSNDFLLMTLVSLSAFPLLALIRSTRAAPAPSREAASHAVMD